MNEEESKLLSEYSDVAITRRGMVLNAIISLERAIDYFIASHFCKEEKYKQELHELILSTERMSFSGKLQVFQALITTHESQFLSNNINLFKVLEGCMKRRNIFAHYQLDTSIEAATHFKSTGEITFVSYTNGIKPKKYSKEKTQSIMNNVYEAHVVINDLNKSNKLKG